MNLNLYEWGTSDWVIAGVVGFALVMGFNAMKLSGSRLRGKRKVWK